MDRKMPYTSGSGMTGSRSNPPPLPPRARTHDTDAAVSNQSPPPRYSEMDGTARNNLISEQWRSTDPRSSSQQSLIPPATDRDGRRRLLTVFVHGFMGKETSFQSFPAHLHNLLTITLSETHIVHTKIYPTYQSRKTIEFAAEAFSKWLEPHEEPDTDIILLGHSLGGILVAEVALLKPYSPASGQAFRHRILGTISFDTPFLGMHPGVISSGIGSLFRPASDPPTPVQSFGAGAGASNAGHLTPNSLSPAQSSLSLLDSNSSDANFNPAYPNDVRLPERKGWESLLNFVTKHSDGLTTATKQYFMSHLEFGGCLADYPGLRARYSKLRALEDVDDITQQQETGYQAPRRRIRFINYYTASTGRPKRPKLPEGHMTTEDGTIVPIETEMKDVSLDSRESASGAATPRLSVTDSHANGSAMTPSIETQIEDLGSDSGVKSAEFDGHDNKSKPKQPEEMQEIDAMPMSDDDNHVPAAGSSEAVNSSEAAGPSEAVDNSAAPESVSQSSSRTEPQLPPIPPPPAEPQPIDLSAYTDKDSRKLAEKEHKRVMKAYQQAVKDRESAIRDQRKIIEKREKRARQEAEKQAKAEEKQRQRDEMEEIKRQATVKPTEAPVSASSSSSSTTTTTTTTQTNRDGAAAQPREKAQRDRKFCMLPPDIGGRHDRCWLRIYMEGVDEVGAHTGLFFAGPHYESLVGDVGDRIEDWVKSDATRRAVLEFSGGA